MQHLLSAVRSLLTITKKDVDEEIYYNVEMYYERRQIVEDLRKVADNDTIVKVAIYLRKKKLKNP